MIFPLNGWLPHDIVQLPQLSPLAPHHRSTSHHLNCAKRFGLLAWRKPDTHRNCMPYQFIHVYHQFVPLSPSNWPFEYSPFRVRNPFRKLSLSTPPDIRYIAGMRQFLDSLDSLKMMFFSEATPSSENQSVDESWVKKPCPVMLIPYIYIIKVSISVHAVHPQSYGMLRRTTSTTESQSLVKQSINSSRETRPSSFRSHSEKSHFTCSLTSATWKKTTFFDENPKGNYKTCGKLQWFRTMIRKWRVFHIYASIYTRVNHCKSSTC